MPGLDGSIYNPVQPHYTATPLFDPGVADPVPVRSGSYCGPAGDSVPLIIGADVLATARATGSRKPMADPAEKPGMVGAFCSVYSPKDLAELLSGEFARSDRDGHFDWIGGTGQHAAGGVRVTDCGHGLFSTHATAPSGQNERRNIYDFIRLHLFGDLDAGVADDMPINRRPSTQEMRNWIKENGPEVMAELRDRQATETADDFAGLDDADTASPEASTTLRPARQLGAKTQVVGGTSVVPKAESASLATAVAVLRRSPTCGYQFADDRFTSRTMLAALGDGPPQWRALTDNDYTRLREGIEVRCGLKVAKEDVRDAVAMVAAENAFDSAQQWLDSLHWDGVPRVRTFLSRYMGAEDSPYTKAVATYFWTAAAGRVLEPGVKVDMTPIAVSSTQGLGKSSSVEALAPNPDWFVTATLSKLDDNLKRLLQGRVVVELAELQGLHGKDAESVKGFLTERGDTWVEKWQTLPMTRPRRLVFFGTSNRHDFLTDPTGNRRFLPFDVGQCDVDAIRRDRDQLWAEGAEIFKASGVAYAEAERLARAELDQFTAVDELESRVAEYLDDPRSHQAYADFPEKDEPQLALPALTVVTVTQIIEGLNLSRPGDPMPRNMQMRVAQCLTALKWKKGKRSRTALPGGQRAVPWNREAAEA